MRVDAWYNLLIQIQEPLLRRESGDYILEFSGHLLCEVENITTNDNDEKTIDIDELEKAPTVGTIQGYIIQAWRAYEDGVDLLDESDAVDSDVCAIVSTFYQSETGKFKKNIMAQFAPNRFDLLGIETLEIHPQHRGQQLGLWMVKRIAERLGGGCGLLTMNIAPPQASLREEEESPVFTQHHETDPEVAETKLVHYFSSLGFENVEGTSYIATSLNNQMAPIEEEDADETEEIVWN